MCTGIRKSATSMASSSGFTCAKSTTGITRIAPAPTIRGMKSSKTRPSAPPRTGEVLLEDDSVRTGSKSRISWMRCMACRSRARHGLPLIYAVEGQRTLALTSAAAARQQPGFQQHIDAALGCYRTRRNIRARAPLRHCSVLGFACDQEQDLACATQTRSTQ